MTLMPIALNMTSSFNVHSYHHSNAPEARKQQKHTPQFDLDIAGSDYGYLGPHARDSSIHSYSLGQAGLIEEGCMGELVVIAGVRHRNQY